MRPLERFAIVLAALALAGCDSADRVPVQGVILKNGVPFTPPEGQSNQVVFIAIDVRADSGKSIGKDEPFAAIVNQSDATFEVPGPDGRGIPPGKYRVSVTQKQRTKHTVDKPKRPGLGLVDRDTDLLGELYGPSNSPLIVEVTRPERLTIDLARPPGAPNP